MNLRKSELKKRYGVAKKLHGTIRIGKGPSKFKVRIVGSHQFPDLKVKKVKNRSDKGVGKWFITDQKIADFGVKLVNSNEDIRVQYVNSGYGPVNRLKNYEKELKRDEKKKKEKKEKEKKKRRDAQTRKKEVVEETEEEKVKRLEKLLKEKEERERIRIVNEEKEKKDLEEVRKRREEEKRKYDEEREKKEEERKRAELECEKQKEEEYERKEQEKLRKREEESRKKEEEQREEEEKRREDEERRKIKAEEQARRQKELKEGIAKDVKSAVSEAWQIQLDKIDKQCEVAVSGLKTQVESMKQIHQNNETILNLVIPQLEAQIEVMKANFEKQKEMLLQKSKM